MEQILFTKNDLAIFLNIGIEVAVVRYEGNSLHSLGPWKAIWWLNGIFSKWKHHWLNGMLLKVHCLPFRSVWSLFGNIWFQLELRKTARSKRLSFSFYRVPVFINWTDVQVVCSQRSFTICTLLCQLNIHPSSQMFHKCSSLARGFMPAWLCRAWIGFKLEPCELKFFYFIQVHNVAFAFELMLDAGLNKPKARPEGNVCILWFLWIFSGIS